MAYCQKEGVNPSQALIPDIEILWESAKVAYQQAEPPTEPGLIDLPVPTPSVMCGFSEQDKHTICRSLEQLTPLLPQIHESWQAKFAEFGGKYTEFIRAPIEAIGLTPLVQAFEREQLNEYNQTVVQAGQQLARDEVPFSLVLHAVHLYEECLLSRLLHVFPEKEQLHNVLVSLDSLFHNHLVTISLAYFQQLHDQRSARHELAAQAEGHAI
jgi:hypothetical protein